MTRLPRTPVLLVMLAVILVGVVLFVTQPLRRPSATTPTATVTKGSIESTVELAGTIAARASRAVGFGASGTVATVDVKVGDLVPVDQPLATLDTELLQAQLDAAQAQLDAADRRLSADQAGPTAIQTAAARAGVSQARGAVGVAQAGLRSTKASQAQTVAAAQRAVTAAKRRLAADTAAGAPAAVIAADQGAVTAAQVVLNAAKSQSAAATAQAQAAVGNAQRALSTANATLKAASAKAPSALIVADRAAVAQATAAVLAARIALDGATLRSPIAGTVTGVGFEVGDRVVAGGTPSALGASGIGGSAGFGNVASGGPGRIVISDLGGLEVDTTASEIDVVQLTDGREATVTLDAIPDATLHGRICRLGAVGAEVQGVVGYPVSICLTTVDPRLRVGMSANGSVLIDHRDGVLVIPTSAIRDVGGRSTVRVVGPDGAVTEVEVTTGLRSGTRTEIVGGLAEGQTIALPAATTGG